MFTHLNKKNPNYLYKFKGSLAIRCDYKESYSFNKDDFEKIPNFNYSEYNYLIKRTDDIHLKFAFNFNAHYNGKCKDGKVDLNKVKEMLKFFNIKENDLI